MVEFLEPYAESTQISSRLYWPGQDVRGKTWGDQTTGHCSCPVTASWDRMGIPRYSPASGRGIDAKPSISRKARGAGTDYEWSQRTFHSGPNMGIVGGNNGIFRNRTWAGEVHTPPLEARWRPA